MNQVYQEMQAVPRVMNVLGSASFLVRPDTATIVLSVITENEELRQAQQENTNRMNRVIQTLRQMGITEENIQTTVYNIQPLYDYVDGQQLFRTYEVMNSIIVTMEDVERIGQVIDRAVVSGVNRVGNIEFKIRQAEQYYQMALREAMQNALAKAQTMAQTLNVSFDPIPIKITEEKKETPPTYQAFAVAATQMAPPIEAGQMEIQARVEVKYRY